MQALVDKATDLLRRGRTPNQACRPRPGDGARIHRTRPLEHPQTGKLIGHSCPCGEILTPSGRQSQVDQLPPGAPGERKPTKAHAARTVAHVLGNR